MLQITVQLTQHTINSPVFPTAEILSFKKDTMLLILFSLIFCLVYPIFVVCFSVAGMWLKCSFIMYKCLTFCIHMWEMQLDSARFDSVSQQLIVMLYEIPPAFSVSKLNSSALSFGFFSRRIILHLIHPFSLFLSIFFARCFFPRSPGSFQCMRKCTANKCPTSMCFLHCHFSSLVLSIVSQVY